jgi:predicted ATPase
MGLIVETAQLSSDLGSVLVERTTELSALEQCLDTARLGTGTGVFIEATAGSGKSCLLRATAEMAQQTEMQVLTASATHLEREFAFGVAIALFEPLWLSLSGRERDSLRAGPAARAAELFDGVASELEPASNERAYPTIRGLFWLVRNLTAMTSVSPRTSSLAILVDDLQWADRASLRFLAYLAERTKELSIAMIVTARPGERADDDQALSTLKNRVGTVLVPGALSGEGVAAMVQRQLPTAVPEFCSACEVATAGNPFLLRALLDELGTDELADIEALSALEIESVRTAVAGRLALMPSPARTVLKAAAVIGDGAAIEQVAALAGIKAATVMETADALAAVELLCPGDPLSFVHPLVRTAVYASLAPLERSEAHRRLAAILAEQLEPSQETAQPTHQTAPPTPETAPPAPEMAPPVLTVSPNEDQHAIESIRAAAAMSARAARARVGKALQRPHTLPENGSPPPQAAGPPPWGPKS